MLQRPSNGVNVSRITPSSNPYRLRSTQPVSSNTVFAIQIGPATNKDRAAASCLASSPVSSRTSTLVSTAVMTSNHLAVNSITHLREGLRFTFGPQAPADVFEIIARETA